MDRGFLPAQGGLESIKQRLAEELMRELPAGLGHRLEKILNAAVEFHPHGKSESEVLDIDFRAISGESLLPTRDDSFGAADFIKLSQVFERSLVGLIASSDLATEDKSRFTEDVQIFFDGFDTALLGQLEEELIARGLLRPAAPLLAEPAEMLFTALGYPKDLADESMPTPQPSRSWPMNHCKDRPTARTGCSGNISYPVAAPRRSGHAAWLLSQ